MRIQEKIVDYNKLTKLCKLIKSNIRFLQFLLCYLALNCNGEEANLRMNLKDENIIRTLEYAKKHFCENHRLLIHYKTRCDNCNKPLNKDFNCTAIDSRTYCGTLTTGCTSYAVKQGNFTQITAIESFLFFSLEDINTPQQTINFLERLYHYASRVYNKDAEEYNKNPNQKDRRELEVIGKAIPIVYRIIRKEVVHSIKTQLNLDKLPTTAEEQILSKLDLGKTISLPMIEDPVLLSQILLVLSCANASHIKDINKKNLQFGSWHLLLQGEEEKGSENSLSLSDTILNQYTLDQLIADLKPLLWHSKEPLSPLIGYSIANSFEEEGIYKCDALSAFMQYARTQRLNLNSNSNIDIQQYIEVFKQKQRGAKTERSSGSNYPKNKIRLVKKNTSPQSPIIKLDPCKNNSQKGSLEENVLAPFLKRVERTSEIVNPTNYEPIINKDTEFTPSLLSNTMNTRIPSLYKEFRYCSPLNSSGCSSLHSTDLIQDREEAYSTPICTKTAIHTEPEEERHSTGSINSGNKRYCYTTELKSPYFAGSDSGSIFTNWEALGLERPKSSSMFNKTEEKVITCESIKVSQCPVIWDNEHMFNTHEIQLLTLVLGQYYDNALSNNPTLLGELILLKREYNDCGTDYYTDFLSILNKHKRNQHAILSKGSSMIKFGKIKKNKARDLTISEN